MSFHGVTPMWWMWNRIWFIEGSCENMESAGSPENPFTLSARAQRRSRRASRQNDRAILPADQRVAA
jgi:hypothetical protein